VLGVNQKCFPSDVINCGENIHSTCFERRLDEVREQGQVTLTIVGTAILYSAVV
jgi:hypothetical protein